MFPKYVTKWDIKWIDESVHIPIPSLDKFIHLVVNICPSTTGDQLERLLILESEFSTLPRFKPALDTVTDFMITVRSTIHGATLIKFQAIGAVQIATNITWSDLLKHNNK